MDDLIAFLRARLDEDEAAANATIAPHAWHPDMSHGGLHAADQEHIARHDPARTLREVAANRAIIRMHEPTPFWGNNPPPASRQTTENVVMYYCECQCPDGVIEGTYPCETSRHLAAIYSDHPDYRDEWKP